MTARAVVLTGSLGMGHHITTQVVTASLAELGFATSTLDCIDLLGHWGGRLGGWAFRELLAAPALYDALHFSYLLPGGRVADTIDRLSTNRLAPALAQILEADPPALVVSTFATGASAIAKLASTATATGRPRPATVVLCTDVSPHSLWVRPGVDQFLVTSPTAAAYVRRHQPSAQVAVVPAPVRASFARAPSRRAARFALGLPADARCALVMGGGWGLGPVAEVAEALADDGVVVLAVAGNNAALYRSLAAIAMRRPGIRPFEFTEEIPQLMAAADVVLTTPGATTCNEARVMNRPLVLLDVVPGHGRDNIQHELETGEAEVCDPDPVRLVPTVLGVLERRPANDTTPPQRRLGPAAWHDAFADALGAAGVALPAPPARRKAAQVAEPRPALVPPTEEID